MEWLFRDITETINVAEVIWTSIGIMGALLCTWLTAIRFRTWCDLKAAGVNGRSRLLAVLRMVRAAMLGTVFLLFVIIGTFAMTLPTNPSINTRDVREAVPSLAIMFMEILLFSKLVIEEVLESVINSMRDMQDAAKSQSTPRLGD